MPTNRKGPYCSNQQIRTRNSASVPILSASYSDRLRTFEKSRHATIKAEAPFAAYVSRSNLIRTLRDSPIHRGESGKDGEQEGPIDDKKLQRIMNFLLSSVRQWEQRLPRVSAIAIH
jgi:hypothetical protein